MFWSIKATDRWVLIFVAVYVVFVIRLLFLAEDLHQAKENFELALGMNANYEKAKSWQRKVRYLDPKKQVYCFDQKKGSRDGADVAASYATYFAVMGGCVFLQASVASISKSIATKKVFSSAWLLYEQAIKLLRL